MSRWRAAFLHLLISVIVAAAVLVPLALSWYPFPWFEPAGGPGLFRILVAVFLISGPVLTLLVFRAGKWGMRFDLWAIGAVQAAGLVFGCWMLYQARPVYVVFNVDRFSLVQPGQLRAEDPASSAMALPLDGPILVGARLPEDPEERHAVTMSALTEGRDLDLMPEYYRPYEGFSAEVLAAGMPLEELVRRNPGRAEHIRAAADSELGGLAVPMVVGPRTFAVLVHPVSSAILGVVEADPWAEPDEGGRP